jgi:hypothetical protein
MNDQSKTTVNLSCVHGQAPYCALGRGGNGAGGRGDKRADKCALYPLKRTHLPPKTPPFLREKLQIMTGKYRLISLNLLMLKDLRCLDRKIKWVSPRGRRIAGSAGIPFPTIRGYAMRTFSVRAKITEGPEFGPVRVPACAAQPGEAVLPGKPVHLFLHGHVAGRRLCAR